MQGDSGNDAPAPPGSSDGGLQFDKVEYASSAPAFECAACHAPITGDYFEIGGKFVCPTCRAQLVRAVRSGGDGERFVIAGVLGALAALAGAVLWWGVRAVTGYEIGLVAIVVGLMVGYAVRYGARGQGGWRYQALAIVLTYLAIALNYAPAMFTPEGEAEASTGALVIAVLVAPIIVGAHSVIGLVIMGFAFYEAWKLNRSVAVEVRGPFRRGVGPAASSETPAG